MPRFITHLGRTFAVAIMAFALSACSGNGGTVSPAGPSIANPAQSGAFNDTASPAATGKINHIVIIVQENRSFDNLFQGYPGADTQSYGYNSSGQKITLQPIGLESWWDINHSSGAFFQACDGTGSLPGTNCKMDGFNKEACWGSNCPSNFQYSYVPHSETTPYFTMASQYVLADRMFASNFDASSFISHQYIIGAQASSAVDYPNGAWGCDGGPSDVVATVNAQRQIPSGYIQACFDNQTLGDELDKAGVSWAYYAATLSGDGSIWSAYQAIRHIRYSKHWSKNIKSPQTRIFQDITNGVLPHVSWVTPTCENSDHAGCGSKTGPAWVASVVNAVGTSKY
ncbi:MAG: alkaline phosphatase family protein, partial [Candidatus Tumulicola sp.]